MATHPNEPEADQDGGTDPSDQPNTSRLPVEPEFLPQGLPNEPEEGGTKRHPHRPTA
jgi:hypothetical protein